jgi:pyruvate/2-oxoglutarate dehydrogenase complex dihydrolipoamide acyltransferase (E2) component
VPVCDVIVPKMGMNSTDVDILNWLVAVGAEIMPGTPLVEVESEKAIVTIESEVSGTVTEILVAHGAVADVGAVICRVEVGEAS